MEPSPEGVRSKTQNVRSAQKMSDLLQKMSDRKSLTEPYIVSCCRSSLWLATASEAKLLECALRAASRPPPPEAGALDLYRGQDITRTLATSSATGFMPLVIHLVG